jgi:hypothetical protein
MNCGECQRLLQEFLDGKLSPRWRNGLDRHLSICRPCREFHGAAQLLEEGLSFLPAPAAPPALSRRVISATLADRRRTLQWRRLAPAAALAAGILLIIVARSGLAPSVRPGPAPLPAADDAALRLSFQDSVTQAGSAVLVLTQRAADETVGSTRVLLPEPNSLSPTFDLRVMQSSVEPPTLPLRDAQEGVVAGLEPVANSARRAVDLLLSEIPVVDSGAAQR